MPLYDYHCTQCDHRYEARHGFDAAPPACPECGFETPTRVITKAPTVAGGMNTPAGDSRASSKEQLRDKWAEETPKLRDKLVSKLGEETVRQNAPSLFNNSDNG